MHFSFQKLYENIYSSLFVNRFVKKTEEIKKLNEEVSLFRSEQTEAQRSRYTSSDSEDTLSSGPLNIDLPSSSSSRSTGSLIQATNQPNLTEENECAQ